MLHTVGSPHDRQPILFIAVGRQRVGKTTLLSVVIPHHPSVSA